MTFDDEDVLVARLVRAGQADGPSTRSLQAAPVAVAALLSSTGAHAALAQAGGAVATQLGKAALSPLVLLKWVAVGTVAGTSLMALVHAPELLRPKPPATVLHAPAPAGSAAARPAAPVESAEPPAAAEPAGSSAAAGVASTPRPDVAREVAALDAARRALVAGDATEALRLLTSLERVPGRALAPEATVLRARALLAQGNAAEARLVSERFCAGAASSPQCAVLRALVANSVIQRPPSRL